MVSTLVALVLLAELSGPSAQPASAGPLDVEPEALRPGLVASYRSLVDKDAVLTRLAPKPAFTLGHSSPHPRLPAGPFEVVWTGVLHLNDPAPLSFEAYLCGELAVEINGATVLRGRGEKETARLAPGAPVQRDPGFYRLRIHYRSLPGLPARLQLWWQGATFAREPLPAWRLMHVAAESPSELAQAQQAEAGRVAIVQRGCARCHSAAFPGITEPPPGPVLADLGRRLNRDWLLAWLADPAALRPEAHMPALFTPERTGFVERWLIADQLLGSARVEKRPPPTSPGDHRMGRRHFVSLGCAACHFLPDLDRGEQPNLGQTPLAGLADRLPAEELAAFLANPPARYPDGRMPRLPLAPDATRDLAAYLLLWSRPADVSAATEKPPTAAEVERVARRLGVRGSATVGAALVREKRCAACHPGLGQNLADNVALTTKEGNRGCFSGQSVPRFNLKDDTRKALTAYLAVAAREKHPAPFASRQRLLDRLGCVRCHQRDSDRPPPLEAIGSTLGSAWLQYVSYQRTPRLTNPHQKFTRSHLSAAIREGVSGLRPSRYSYRMPAFGHDAEAIVQALAEADGELPAEPEPTPSQAADPTLATLHGSRLAGFQGYACVSCHIWNGQTLSEADPGTVGTDLTRVAGRIRRDWFDRFLEGPARSHPNTPMPAIFQKGKPASLPALLDGDPVKQKDALWSYLALGKAAPSPKPPPPLAVTIPRATLGLDDAEPALVAQIPVRLPDGKTVESLCILTSDHNLIVYDLATMKIHSGWTGARLLRSVQGRLRSYTVTGTPVKVDFGGDLRFESPGKSETPTGFTFHRYELARELGVRLRWQARFPSATVEVDEFLSFYTRRPGYGLVHNLAITGVPAGHSVNVSGGDSFLVIKKGSREPSTFRLERKWPRPHDPKELAPVVLSNPEVKAGSLDRPGYRAIAYPRPKTVTGEDLIMPGAVAANPKDGRVFIASMKLGELFVLHDPTDDGKQARFDNYARGLFQEAYSMLAEPDALYVLHRRNLTKVVDTNGDGVADRFDRVATLPHGLADTYDYGYGLVRDRGGAFVLSYAPYANRKLPGSGGAIRLVPGKDPQEIAFGFRNPVGWCAGPDGEIFFTDNQGEWVATNKLCHVVEGRYYGFPNPEQQQHTTRPRGKTTVWVPYAWAKSINGVTFDNTGGKFGPFAGQFFLAELMFGGAIIRANVEKVNGEYQGACFPFWGQGLLGPLSLAFDPKGRLFVGGITEPGWMAQPDRGALFRLDWTGQVPFEMQSIHVQPRGFRIVFTAPVSPQTARDVAAYQIESFRYEYTGAYGSPELDRARLAIERVELAADGRSVNLLTAPLVKDRVYLIHGRGVYSAKGETLVHPTGAYTLNEIPGQ